MKKLALALSPLFLLTLTCCGSGNAVVGSYELDKSELEKMMKAEMPAMPAGDEGKMALDMMKQMLDGMQMTIDLKADGTMTGSAKMGGMPGMPAKDEPMTGTWKLDGSKITMTGKGKDGKEETKVGDYADGTITITEEGKKMVLRRK